MKILDAIAKALVPSNQGVFVRFIRKNGRVIPIRDNSGPSLLAKGAGLVSHSLGVGAAGVSGYAWGTSLHARTLKSGLSRIGVGLGAEYVAKITAKQGDAVGESTRSHAQKWRKAMLGSYLTGMGLGAFEPQIPENALGTIASKIRSAGHNLANPRATLSNLKAIRRRKGFKIVGPSGNA